MGDYSRRQELFRRNSGAAYSSRTLLSNLLKTDGSTVADYQPGNYTGTLNASAWLNSIGAAPSLAQASGAAQPIILPFSGQKYLANFGGTTNQGITTPETAGNMLVGDMSVVAKISANVLNQIGGGIIADQYFSLGHYNWSFRITGAGYLALSYSTDGTTVVNVVSTQTLASLGISAVQDVYVGAYQDVDNGASGNDVYFYWWLPGGTPNLIDKVTTAGAITRHTSTDAIAVTRNDIIASSFQGKVYSFALYSGNYFNGTGTLVVNALASDWPETTTNGATAVSSTTGETWTLANTGTLLAQIVGSPQLLFDGAAMLMTATYAQNLPIFWIIVGKQITWVSLAPILGNLNFDVPIIRQRNAGTSPQVEMANGTAAPSISPTLNTYSIISAGDDSAGNVSIQLNNGTAVTATGGTVTSITGFAVGGDTFHARYFNGQYKEIISLNAIPSAAKLANIRTLLNVIHRVY